MSKSQYTEALALLKQSTSQGRLWHVVFFVVFSIVESYGLAPLLGDRFKRVGILVLSFLNQKGSVSKIIAFTIAVAIITVYIIRLSSTQEEFRRAVSYNPYFNLLNIDLLTVNFVQQHGRLATVPYNFFLGNTLEVAKLCTQIPRDANFNAICTVLYRKYNLGAVFYLDLWPAMNVRQMIINDPIAARQVSSSPSLPKHPIIKVAIESLTGPRSMFFAEGQELKQIRSMFGPAFSAAHLSTITPRLIDLVSTFSQNLSVNAATGKPFKMAEMAADVTMDMIGHIVLGQHLGAQDGDNEFVAAYQGAVRWKNQIGPFQFFNPWTFLQRKYSRKMDEFLRNAIVERYQNRNSLGHETYGKPAVDLAFDAYHLAKGGADDGSGFPDEEFMLYLIDQMKTFVVAGHETTASALAYIYYLLSINPDKLDRVREELDQVLGPQDGTADVLKQRPRLLNQLSYTTAVIKGKFVMCDVLFLLDS